MRRSHRIIDDIHKIFPASNRTTDAAIRAAGGFRPFEILENREDFPFVSVRVAYPRLVLKRIAATALHLIARPQSDRGPLVANRHDVGSASNLQSEMRQCPFSLPAGF